MADSASGFPRLPRPTWIAIGAFLLLPTLLLLACGLVMSPGPAAAPLLLLTLVVAAPLIGAASDASRRAASGWDRLLLVAAASDGLWLAVVVFGTGSMTFGDMAWLCLNLTLLALAGWGVMRLVSAFSAPSMRTALGLTATSLMIAFAVSLPFCCGPWLDSIPVQERNDLSHAIVTANPVLTLASESFGLQLLTQPIVYMKSLSPLSGRAVPVDGGLLTGWRVWSAILAILGLLALVVGRRKRARVDWVISA